MAASAQTSRSTDASIALTRPRASAYPMKSDAATTPGTRPIPAHQRFERHDRARLDAHDRLIIRNELAPLDRPAQRVLQIRLGGNFAAHLRIEDRVTRASVGFRRVHRDVGVAKEFVGAAISSHRRSRRRWKPPYSTRVRRAASARAGTQGSGPRARPASSGKTAAHTTNSSPPKRAIVSLSGSESRSRTAIIFRSSSPARCPSVSLIMLKRSRSMKKSAYDGSPDVTRNRRRSRVEQRRSIRQTRSARRYTPLSATPVSIVLRTSISRSRLACSSSSFRRASCERQFRVIPKPNMPANTQTIADCTTLSNEMRRSPARSAVASVNRCRVRLR